MFIRKMRYIDTAYVYIYIYIYYVNSSINIVDRFKKDFSARKSGWAEPETSIALLIFFILTFLTLFIWEGGRVGHILPCDAKDSEKCLFFFTIIYLINRYPCLMLPYSWKIPKDSIWAKQIHGTKCPPPSLNITSVNSPFKGRVNQIYGFPILTYIVIVVIYRL